MKYDYECDSCGAAWVSADRAERECPECGTGGLSWFRARTGALDTGEGDPESGTLRFFIKGHHKNSKPLGHYEMPNRGFHPDLERGLDPDTYENAHERDFHDAEKRAAEVAGLRKMTRREDDEIRHVGRIPLAQFLARQSETRGDTDQLYDRSYWKHQGRIFKHEG